MQITDNVFVVMRYNMLDRTQEWSRAPNTETWGIPLIILAQALEASETFSKTFKTIDIFFCHFFLILV